MSDDLIIDFASAHHHYRRLFGGGKQQTLAKAIGLHSYKLPLKVIDATAGYGEDAFVLASLGCEVILLERIPVLAQHLQAALVAGAANPEIATIIRRMQLMHGDALQILPTLKDRTPDVVYLDPMFPERRKSALVKGKMQLLQQIVGTDPDADQLLPIARAVAKRRVVVKRPRQAPYLQDLTPHFSYLGRANRFDLYMPSA